MEGFPEIVAGINRTGMSDSAIARYLTARGIKVTQASISRIRTGDIKNPRYELGDGLKNLYADCLARASKSSTGNGTAKP